jgi:hypothetical protein
MHIQREEGHLVHAKWQADEPVRHTGRGLRARLFIFMLRNATSFCLRRYPRGPAAVVLQPGSFVELVLGGIHGEVRAAVLLARRNGIEGHRHVLFGDAEESANRHNEALDFAVLANQHVSDLCNLGVSVVVYALLVVVGDGGGIVRDSGEDPGVLQQNDAAQDLGFAG